MNIFLLRDIFSYLWHADQSVDGHFRIGSPTKSYIECRWETIDKHRVRKLIVRKDEHTHLQVVVEPYTNLDRLLYLAILQANHLTNDSEYQECVKRKTDKSRMEGTVNVLIESFFRYDNLKGLDV